MRTEFEAHNKTFSDKAHRAAQRDIYPHVFGANLRYEDVTDWDVSRNHVLDGEMAVDRIIRAKPQALQGSFSLTVQERFRRIQYAPYRDITITEWNGASSLPGELYKIKALYFAYGYYDSDRDCFLDALVVDVSKLLWALQCGRLAYGKRQNGKRQSFITVGFDALHKCEAILWRKDVE